MSIEELAQAGGVSEVRAGHGDGKAEAVKERHVSERVKERRNVEWLAQTERKLLEGGMETINGGCEMVDEDLFVCLVRQYMI
jgi:hypothetical protein